MLIGLLLAGAAALGIWGVGSTLFREVEPLDELEKRDTPGENDGDNSWLSHKAPLDTDFLFDPAYSSSISNIWHKDDDNSSIDY